jgi:peptide methionine sulfoxide reductase MsrA
MKSSLFAASLALCMAVGHPALAADISTSTASPPQTNSSSSVPTIYFGNGCFWGRQYDFINAEKSLGRKEPKQMSAVVGYAGGRTPSKDGRVCYYYAPGSTIYESLGHAEVVKVNLDASNDDIAKSQFKKFADTYFSEFKKTPQGVMQRQDPQDAGPGYRNVVGLPGGINSPLFSVLKEANVNNMVLVEGKGNEYTKSGPTEDDVLNTVWVVDSEQLPFYQAEVYHQFHNGLGKAFPKQYTRDLKEKMKEVGTVAETGCPEYFFLNS